MGLIDDACTLEALPGTEWVITADALVSGIHFLAGDPPDRIARKMLRVNLSDLAAKGARPIGYVMTLALPSTITEEWIAAFVRGLAEDQAFYDIALLGGDTTATPGIATLSVTAIGDVPLGQALRRRGARAGDKIFVTGSIGDGYLGLRTLRGEYAGLAESDRRFLIDRYQLPEPRVALGRLLGARKIGRAGMDISDGLLGDLAHMARASGCRAQIHAPQVPLSKVAASLVAADFTLLNRLLTAGDDYELLIAVAEGEIQDLRKAAAEAQTPISEIGIFMEGEGVEILDRQGNPLEVEIRGYTHF